MSDFDKEAEREKLREKYGDEYGEGSNREATRQMSELLLQGATMTNKHCDDCGDPIFRHQDQEFCPTCHTEGQSETQEGARGDDTEGAERSQEAATRSAQPSTPADQSNATQAESTASQDQSTASQAESDAPSRASEPRRTDAPERGSPAGQSTTRTGVDRIDVGESSPAPPNRGRAESDAGDGDLASAERSLRRTLVRFAERAERAEDPRTAREALSTAREAAEALSALRR